MQARRITMDCIAEIHIGKSQNEREQDAMIDGIYEISIDTPLANRPGRAELHSSGDTVTGVIDAPVIGEQSIEGKLDSENSFTAEGSFPLFLFGVIEYTLKCAVNGDDIDITILSSKGNFNFTGTRVQ